MNKGDAQPGVHVQNTQITQKTAVHEQNADFAFRTVDHADAQGAMTAPARKNKKVNILNDITVFLRTKGWKWHNEQHLFSAGKEQHRMRKYCGKKVGGEFYILMLKPDDEESA